MSVQFSEREYMIGEKDSGAVYRGPAIIYEEVPNNISLTFDVNNNSRFGINIQSDSVLVGQKVKKMVVLLTRTNSNADGQVLARVRDSADVIKATSENSINAYDVAIVAIAYPFTFIFANPVEIEDGDNILIESAAVAALNPGQSLPGMFDGTETRRQRFIAAAYTPSNTTDMSGKLLTR